MHHEFTIMAPSTSSAWSLTSHLLAVDKAAYQKATRAPFLEAAGQGRVDKLTLGKWLANDRLYTHAYVKAAGRALAAIDLPQSTATPASAEPALVDWLCDTLVALRREDRLFVEVADRYGIPIDLETEPVRDGPGQAGSFPRVREGIKSQGLILFERLFGGLRVPTVDPPLLPWLEAAVVFWGTERVYSDAWAWAKACQGSGGGDDDGGGKGAETDADGGALRKEFVPNWSSEDFVAFVGKLGDVLDGAVSRLVEAHGEGAQAGLVARAERVWRELVAAEGAFWPDVE